MAWLWVVLVVVVLGVTASVAVGRGGSMGRAYPDRRDVRLPADRPVTAHDLKDVRLSVVLRGYRMDEVDDLLVRLTQELAARDAELARLAPGRPAGDEHASELFDQMAPPPEDAPPVARPASSTYAAPPPSDAAPPTHTYADSRPSEPDDGYVRHPGDTPTSRPRPGAGDL